MKLDARSALPVYPVWKAQGHGKNVRTFTNIADRLPENSRNRFVDRQSKKNSKKDRPKNSSFY